MNEESPNRRPWTLAPIAVAALSLGCGGEMDSAIIVNLTSMPARPDAETAEIAVRDSSIMDRFRLAGGLSDLIPVKLGLRLDGSLVGTHLVVVDVAAEGACASLTGSAPVELTTEERKQFMVDIEVREACSAGSDDAATPGSAGER